MNPALKWMPLVTALAVAGCARDGYFDDRGDDYIAAESVPPLQLPENRDTSRIDPVMPVPEARGEFQAWEDDFEVPRPSAVGVGGASRTYVERREVGQDAWLVVNDRPGAVWPRLEDFSRRQGLTVTSSDAARGTLETPEGTLSVRQGVGGGVSEVRCERGGQVVSRCLSALQGFLSAQGQTASASNLSDQRTVAATDPVRVERRGDDWLMLIDADPESAWAELGHRLEANFDQEGRQRLLDGDPAAGEFLIEYQPQSVRERGLFGTMVNFGADDARRLRLRLEPDGGRTRVRVVGADGEPFGGEDARELLDRLAALLR